MMKKLLAIWACVLMVLASLAIILRPENLEVKADSGGGGNGNEVGINTTYIHSVAETLSYIVKDRNYPKGRTYGTDGEKLAAYYIENWMNQTGLYNVHKEDITYGFNETGSIIAIDKKVEDLSEGLTINNTNINKSEFYISPRNDRAFYAYYLWKNKTEDPSYWNLMTNNFSYYDVSLQQRPQRLFLSHVLAWCIVEATWLIEIGTIYNFDTFAWYMLEKAIPIIRKEKGGFLSSLKKNQAKTRRFYVKRWVPWQKSGPQRV